MNHSARGNWWAPLPRKSAPAGSANSTSSPARGRRGHCADPLACPQAQLRRASGLSGHRGRSPLNTSTNPHQRLRIASSARGPTETSLKPIPGGPHGCRGLGWPHSDDHGARSDLPRHQNRLDESGIAGSIDWRRRWQPAGPDSHIGGKTPSVLNVEVQEIDGVFLVDRTEGVSTPSHQINILIHHRSCAKVSPPHVRRPCCP